MKIKSIAGPVGIFGCRMAHIVLCLSTLSMAMTASNTQSFAGSKKIGRMAVNSSGIDAGVNQADSALLNYAVNAQAKKLVDTYVEYYPSTCQLVSSGSWAVASAPSRGDTDTGIVNGYLANGDCSGVVFPFAAIYYTWTSSNPTNPKDSFSATWTSGDPDFPPHTDGYDIALIVPTSYRQAGHAATLPDGTLSFKYRWGSTTGNIADLTQCQVGERVTYPGGSPFNWPSPPYHASSPNPTVAWVIATKGVGLDFQYPPTHQAGGGFVEPYRYNLFIATQQYRYQCLFLNTEAFPGWSDISITRVVNDQVKGCWTYTITKTGGQNSILLPADPKTCAPASSSSAEIKQSQFKNNGADIGLSVAPPEAAIALNAPIPVDLSVSSLSAGVANIDLGLNGKANLELRISEPTGGIVTRTLDLEGFGASGKHSLQPGATYAERLLLNEWYEFSQVGTYRIKLTLLNDDQLATGLPQPSTEFSVKINPHDSSGLAVICQELADQAINGETLEERMDAANTLSYIRDPLAVDSLVRVLWQGSLVSHYAVTGLARIANPQALSALEAAQDHPVDDVRAMIHSTLEELHNQIQ